MEEIEWGSDTFCTVIRKNFAKCTAPARELIVGCLPEKSKDLPMLAEKIVSALIDQACNSTVEEIVGKLECDIVIMKKYNSIITEGELSLFKLYYATTIFKL